MNSKIKSMMLVFSYALLYTMHTFFNVIGTTIKFACLAFVVFTFAACATTKNAPFPSRSQWVLTVNNKAVEYIADKPVTINFDGDKVSGFSGVNTFTGNYRTDNKHNVSFGLLASTRMFAINGGANAMEKDFFDKMSRVDGYKKTKKELRLYSGNKLLLRFKEKQIY